VLSGGQQDVAATADAPSPSPAPAKDAVPAGARASAEPGQAATPPLDRTEPPQTAQGSASPETRAAPAPAAASPVLSTLSQGAIHATAQIAAQIVKKLEGRSTRFEMALTPDDLGRVDVSLDIDADGQLSARLAFDNPLAAADLRGRVDELRRQLTEAGFTLADDALSFDQRDPSAGDGSAFDRGTERQSARAFGAASRLSLDAEATLAPPRWMSLTLTPERVDLKV
jgi:flagellar hook-length control protein FliK